MFSYFKKVSIPFVLRFYFKNFEYNFSRKKPLMPLVKYFLTMILIQFIGWPKMNQSSASACCVMFKMGKNIKKLETG